MPSEAPKAPPRLRPARAGDARAVRDLVFGTLREYGLDPDPVRTDSDLDRFPARYVEAGGAFDVLEDPNGTVVGCVGLMPLGDGVVELRKMYLVRGCRGRGQGRRLLEHALEAAAERGYRRVELETAGPLREAQALYESYGFAPFESDRLSSRCDRAYRLDLPAKPREHAAGAGD